MKKNNIINTLSSLFYSKDIKDLLLAYDLYTSCNQDKTKFFKVIIKELLKQDFKYSVSRYSIMSPSGINKINEDYIRRNLKSRTNYYKHYELGCLELVIHTLFSINQYTSFKQNLLSLDNGLLFSVVIDDCSFTTHCKTLTDVLNKLNQFFKTYEKKEDTFFYKNFKW